MIVKVHYIRIWLLVIGALIAVIPAIADDAPDITERYCVSPPYGEPCAVIPQDQALFSRHFIYMIMSQTPQNPFDMFSWQNFVAFNWAADAAGHPLSAPIGTQLDAPRVWQSFDRRQAVIGRDPAQQTCGALAGPDDLLITELEQADGTVLIDQAGNFAVYDTRLNPVAVRYIRQTALHTLSGQAGRGGQVSFPQGEIGGQPASYAFKTSWRILTEQDNNDRFLTRSGIIYVPSERSATGEALCLPAILGMVGMHIIARTASGNGDNWIWSTFEHMDNAPLAANAREINDIYDYDLFPTGCHAPQTAVQSYSFFDADCPECETNAPTTTDWSWNTAPPYALSDDGQSAPSTQVVRCWEVFTSTQAVNARWQAQLSGTVFANYMLLPTQWRGAEISPLFEHGEVPRYLSNVTMETFIQYDPSGSCLGCHAEARTASGQSANFLYSLSHAE